MVNSKLPVRDVMISPVITISPEETVANAAKVMLKNGIGGLIVSDNSQAIGMITERDFVGLLAKKKTPGELFVKDVMAKRLVTISPNEGLMDAAKLIVKTGKRKLPVMDNGKLIGIITADDIVKAAPGEVETLRELVNIKSEDVTFREDSPTEGECETCNNYSESLKKVGDSYLCEDCKRARDEEE